jgi:hypothetical protein
LLLPLFVSGKGPKKSIWTRSIGAPGMKISEWTFCPVAFFKSVTLLAEQYD